MEATQVIGTIGEDEPKTHSQPIPVVYMIDHLYAVDGGGEQALLKILRHLPRDRFSPSVVTFIAKDRSLELLHELRCPTHVYPMRRTYDWNGLKAAIRVRSLLRSEQVRIVHTFFETSNTWGGLITKLSGPMLVSSRRDMGILKRAKHRAAYRLINKLSDGVQVVSGQLRRICVETDRLPPDRVFTGYNGVDIDRIDGTETSSAQRSEFGLCGASHVVCTVASIRAVKGLDTFVQAAAIVHRELPSARFVIAGACQDPNYLRELQQMITALRLQNHVCFLGSVNEVFSLLKLSDVFCMLSRSEGFSNALLEAMACSLPCVATSVGGTPEVLKNGENGFLIPPEDPRKAASRILTLLQSPTVASRIGKAARKTVETHFTSQLMVTHLVQLYERLLSSEVR